MLSSYIGIVARRLAMGAIGLTGLIGATSLGLVAGEPPATVRAEETSAPGGPRVVIRLSRDLFAPLVDRAIDVTKPVVDVIAGTPVRGSSRTVGRPTLDLTDNPHAACFTVTMSGTTVSRTTASEGPAVVRSRSETAFTATKRVTFQPGTGFIAEPARVNARTRVTTEGIESTRQGLFGVIGRAVQRRAAAEIAERQDRVLAETRQRAETRIAASFDQALEERLADLNRRAKVQDRLAGWLGREGETIYRACTREGCVHLMAVPKNQPVVEILLPPLREEEAPVQVWMHRSLVGDQMADVLRRMDNAELPPVASAALDAVPARMRPDLGLLTRRLPLDYAAADDWIVLQYRPDDDFLMAGNDRQRVDRPAPLLRR
jgi:hypothetical protein